MMYPEEACGSRQAGSSSATELDFLDASQWPAPCFAPCRQSRLADEVMSSVLPGPCCLTPTVSFVLIWIVGCRAAQLRTVFANNDRDAPSLFPRVWLSLAPRNCRTKSSAMTAPDGGGDVAACVPVQPPVADAVKSCFGSGNHYPATRCAGCRSAEAAPFVPGTPPTAICDGLPVHRAGASSLAVAQITRDHLRDQSERPQSGRLRTFEMRLRGASDEDRHAETSSPLNRSTTPEPSALGAAAPCVAKGTRDNNTVIIGFSPLGPLSSRGVRWHKVRERLPKHP